MKDAFVGVMCLMLFVDFIERIRDKNNDVMSICFNGVLLAWGLLSLWR